MQLKDFPHENYTSVHCSMGNALTLTRIGMLTRQRRHLQIAWRREHRSLISSDDVPGSTWSISRATITCQHAKSPALEHLETQRHSTDVRTHIKIASWPSTLSALPSSPFCNTCIINLSAKTKQPFDALQACCC